VPTQAPTPTQKPNPTAAPVVVPTPAPTPVPTAAPVIDSVPKTGDEAPVGLWLTLMLSSLAGMIAICGYVIKRKKYEDE